MTICPLCWITDHELRETPVYKETYALAKDKTPEEIDEILNKRSKLEKWTSGIVLTNSRAIKLAYTQARREKLYQRYLDLAEITQEDLF